MDFLRQRAEHSAAMRIGWRVAVGTVLRSRARNGRKSAFDATAGRTIHADAILRGPKDGLVAGRARIPSQSEAGTAVDASDGIGGDLCQAAAVASGAGAQDLPVSVAGFDHQPAGPGVVQRHHLHSIARGIHLPGGSDGLVQPLCAGLGSIGLSGNVILRFSAELGFGVWAPGYLQYGSGIAVHEPRFHKPVGGSRHRHQHGRTWTRDGQHFHRTFVEDGEIRRDLFERLRGRAGSDGESENLFWVLQSRAPHQALGYQTPAAIYFQARKEPR